MSLGPTIFKAGVATIADIDRGYYADHALTLARHPSESDERMMIRLLAFVLHAARAAQLSARGCPIRTTPICWCAI